MTGLETWTFTKHDFRLPLRYRLAGPKDRPVVVVLHGYQDHALSMLKRLGWNSKEDLPFRVLAINGPFPVPIWKTDGFTEAYAWYFRDATRGIEVGSPAMVANAIYELMTSIGLIDAPAVVFGFSQGGFLAPALAARLPDPRAIVCCGGGFPWDLYKDLPKLPVYGIHGDKDGKVPAGPAREAHAKLMAEGFSGEFLDVPGLDHRVTPAVEEIVRKLVAKTF